MVAIKRASFLRLGSHKFINYRFVFEDLVKRCSKQGCLVLDAGCGQGTSIVSPPEGVKLVGIDIDRANVVACKRRWGNRSYVVGDLSILPFTEGVFGGAISADVLEHVDDTTTAINELSRVTQRGGFFIGCSTNILNPILWLDVKFPMLMKPLVMKLADPGHYERHRRFSPSSLKKTMDSTGYSMDYFYLLGLPQSSQMWNNLMIGHLWIIFDKLTKKKILMYFKEMLLWQATKV